MTGVRSRVSGIRSQETGDRLAPRAWWFACVVVLVALPIFAHGCHRGDHDDEPVFVPMDHHKTNVELPP